MMKEMTYVAVTAAQRDGCEKMIQGEKKHRWQRRLPLLFAQRLKHTKTSFASVYRQHPPPQ
jgi:hypothetical protein